MAKRITDYFFEKYQNIEKKRKLIIENRIPGTSTDSSSSTLDTTENESQLNTEWYKGSKLDVTWLLQTFSMLKKIKLDKRSGLKCMLCFEQISEALKFSRNRQVPIADGIRCDGKRELMRVVDHLHSDAHDAAHKADET